MSGINTNTEAETIRIKMADFCFMLLVILDNKGTYNQVKKNINTYLLCQIQVLFFIIVIAEEF